MRAEARFVEDCCHSPVDGLGVPDPEVTCMRHARLVASVTAASVLLSVAALAEVDKKTERLWKAQCASCHGQGGKGDTDVGKQMKVQDMTTAAFQAKKDDELKNAITNGAKSDSGKMDPFKDLTPDQVNSLIALMRSFKK
jgi:mono/diheme cytochrome c family protein